MRWRSASTLSTDRGSFGRQLPGRRALLTWVLPQVVPWLLDLATRNQQLACYRHAVINAAAGRVLDAGYMPGPKPWTFIYQGSGKVERRQISPYIHRLPTPPGPL